MTIININIVILEEDSKPVSKTSPNLRSISNKLPKETLANPKKSDGQKDISNEASQLTNKTVKTDLNTGKIQGRSLEFFVRISAYPSDACLFYI